MPLLSIIRVLKDLFRLFTRWTSVPMHKVEAPRILGLPAELVLLVIDYLEPHSVISLALTCRSFYNSYFPRSAKLSGPSQDALLTMLERDLPDQLYCPRCAALHTWEVDLKAGRLDIPVSISSKTCHAPSFRQPGSLRSLSYHHARLIMNHHLYGERHGLPAHLVPRGGYRSFFVDVDVKSTWQARVIDDELFLRIDQTATQPSGNMTKLERYLREDMGGYICRHRAVWDPIRPHPESSTTVSCCPRPNLKYEKPRDCPLPSLHAEMQCEKILSCPICMTDAQVLLGRAGQREKWSVRLVTWKRLGSCRSPSDPVWWTMTQVSRFMSQREPRAKTHPPGDVRRKWLEADKTSSNMDEYFLEATQAGD
ncbi:hypothetical protein C8035_v011715 [Colletotrichum spinosum]|uniref:F-box domain-containing protein n=1 Tax=Colletotrichum spinosum TaxID=1347390 RepID=A0A4R8Q919_9PEZI|nr:hypothetical protein C8035_v011715 [Colletotrichum spinosum]